MQQDVKICACVGAKPGERYCPCGRDMMPFLGGVLPHEFAEATLEDWKLATKECLEKS